jgi:Ca2+-binding RTX toxin-like protein
VFQYRDDFNDGILNADGWTYQRRFGGPAGASVSEHDGFLDIQTDQTDNGGQAMFTLAKPLEEFSVSLTQLFHATSWDFLADTRLFFLTASGEELIANVRMLNTNYQQYFTPQVNTYYDAAIPEMRTEYGADLTTTYLDKWIETRIVFNGSTGLFQVDIDGDSVSEFSFTDERFIGTKLSAIDLNSYGWFTGQYRYVDEIVISGSYIGGPAPVPYSLVPSQSIASESGSVAFVITRADAGAAETLYFSTISATASFGEGDYALAGGGVPQNVAVTFAPGETRKTITVNILQDGQIDGGERFRAIIQSNPDALATVYLARSEYVTISEAASTTLDTVREGTDTASILTPGAWISGSIDAEPIAGDGVAPDGAGGLVDKDWYAITLEAGTVYALEARSVSLTTGMVSLRLYDAAGLPVAGTLLEGAAPALQFDTAGQAQATATYYLAVSAGDTNNTDFRLATGAYEVRYLPVSVDPAGSDTVREGTDTTSSLQEGLWRTGRIDAEPLSGDGGAPDGLGGLVDKDWYRLNLTEGRVYEITAESLGLSSGQVSLMLLDASGTAVAGMTTSGASPRLVFDTRSDAATGPNYFLAVAAADGGSGARLTATGDFQVRVGDFGASPTPALPGQLGFTDNIITKLAALADAAYYESTEAAGRDGFRTIDLRGFAGMTEASFVSIESAGGLLDNNFHFYEAEVDGERSLFLAFSGTQENQKVLDLVLQVGRWGEIYDAQSGNVSAVLTWANGAAARGESAFENVFVTGHSLGGVLVEEFFASDEFTSSPLARNAYGVTFGSPGSPRDAIDDSRLLNFVNMGDPVAALHSDDLFGFVFDDSKSADVAQLSVELLTAAVSDPRDTVAALTNELIGAPPSREGTTIIMADVANPVLGVKSLLDTHSMAAYTSSVGTLTDFYRYASRSGADELAFWNGQENGTFALEEWSDLEFALAVAQGFSFALLDYALLSTPRVFIGLAGPGISGVQTGYDNAISFTANLIDEVQQTAGGVWSKIEGTAEALNEKSVSAINKVQLIYTDLSTPIANFLFRPGSAIIDIDVNGDGETDYTTRIEGTFDLTRFLTYTGAGGTVLLYTEASQLLATHLGDQLVGDANGNIVDGLEGNDLVFGLGGSDLLYGGLGSDTLLGGVSSDELFGGMDDDELLGEEGNDTLKGGAGNDTLSGGAGNDTLKGGVGTDTASYADAVSGVTVNLGLTTAQVTGGAGTDVLRGIENLVGSGFNDVLTGNTEANRIEGGVGNDRLIGSGGADYLGGGAGNDTLNGGGGNDWLEGGLGDDVLNGGAGFDRAVFTGATAVTVNLAIVGLQDTGLGLDTLIDIEAVTSGSGNDLLIGNALANTLNGGLGDDTIRGGAGNDTVNGADGDDVLTGGGGNDLLVGGAGIDTAVYAGAVGAVVNLAILTAQNTGLGIDTLSGIENLTGGTFADRLTGDGQANRLEGDAGNDTLQGGGGDDTLLGGEGDDRLGGGSGNDFLEGGLGADQFVFNTGGGNDIVADFEDGLDRILIGTGAESFSDLELSEVGSDTVITFSDVIITLAGITQAQITSSDFLFV